MRVRELMERLDECNPDHEVVVEGDPPVDVGLADPTAVEFSEPVVRELTIHGPPRLVVVIERGGPA